MVDKDEDNMNDTLMIELETNGNAGTYIIFIFINHKIIIIYGIYFPAGKIEIKKINKLLQSH